MKKESGLSKKEKIVSGKWELDKKNIKYGRL